MYNLKHVKSPGPGRPGRGYRMSLRNVLAAAVLASVVAFSAMPAGAQVLYGTLTGNVTDISGATVPNAKVEAVNTGTGQVKETVADDKGEYIINDVQAGRTR